MIEKSKDCYEYPYFIIGMRNDAVSSQPIFFENFKQFSELTRTLKVENVAYLMLFENDFPVPRRVHFYLPVDFEQLAEEKLN